MEGIPFLLRPAFCGTRSHVTCFPILMIAPCTTHPFGFLHLCFKIPAHSSPFGCTCFKIENPSTHVLICHNSLAKVNSQLLMNKIQVDLSKFYVATGGKKRTCYWKFLQHPATNVLEHQPQAPQNQRSLETKKVQVSRCLGINPKKRYTLREEDCFSRVTGISWL